MVRDDLERHRLLGHALLQLIVDDGVVDAEAAEDAERLEEQLVVLVERVAVQPIGDLRAADDVAVAVAYRHAEKRLGLVVPYGVHKRIETRVAVLVRQVDPLARDYDKIGQVARNLPAVIVLDAEIQQV